MINRILIASLAAAGLSSCASLDPISQKTPLNKKTEERIAVVSNPATKVIKAPASASKVSIDNTVRIPLTPRVVDDSAWLKKFKVNLKVSDKIVPLSEVIKSLSAQGLNITSELVLDNFQYSGFSITNAEADSALKLVLGSSGLDFYADPVSKVITIKPMATKTWYLNIGNRKSKYLTGGQQSQSQQQSSNNSNNASGSNGSGSTVSTGTSLAATGVQSIQSDDDFWLSLKDEMNNRLKLLMPDVKATEAVDAPIVSSPVVPPMPGVPGTEGVPTAPPTMAVVSTTKRVELKMTETKIGTFSINPETGAVTVQAPHWVLSDMDSYFKRVQAMYNTDLVFEGELLLLSTGAERSEGLDISSFGSFAKGRYNMQVVNNALGGVTVSSAAAVAQNAISGTLLGVSSVADGLQIFNAYLSNLGKVTSLQKPVLTTTSGVPANFTRTTVRSYNSVSQTAASGGAGGAAVGTQNTLVERETGTILRINPRIDVATGLIRAQIELVQTNQIDTQSLQQSLTTNNSVVSVPVQVPVISKIIYTGEALLKNGDTIVMGGQSDEDESANKDGVTGLMDHSSPVRGLFSKSNVKKNKNVFYFALKVTVNNRNQ